MLYIYCECPFLFQCQNVKACLLPNIFNILPCVWMVGITFVYGVSFLTAMEKI